MTSLVNILDNVVINQGTDIIFVYSPELNTWRVQWQKMLAEAEVPYETQPELTNELFRNELRKHAPELADFLLGAKEWLIGSTKKWEPGKFSMDKENTILRTYLSILGQWIYRIHATAERDFNTGTNLSTRLCLRIGSVE